MADDEIPAQSERADEARQMLDTSATGITRCSRDLRYLSANPAYAKLVGLPAERIIGRPISDVMGTEAYEVIRPYVARVLRGERVEYEEELSYAASGRKFLHVVYTPWIDAAGTIAGWVASVSDITDLKQTTTSLRESEERLRLATSTKNIGFFDWDVQTGQLTWSPELYEIVGLQAGAIQTYEDFRSRVHLDDIAAVESERNTAIRDHKQYDVEFRIIRPSAEIRWLSVRAKGYYDEGGRLVRVIGNGLDITERKRLEESLRESEERLRLAMSSGTIGVWDWDVSTGLLTVSPEVGRIYGVDLTNLRSYEDFAARVHPDDLARVESDRAAAIHNRRPFDTEFRIVLPSGEIRWIAAKGQGYYDENGSVMRVVGNNIDITDRKRLEESHRQNAERQAFLLGLSDALRTADPGAMQALACRMLGEHLQLNRVYYADIEGDELIPHGSWAKDVPPHVRRGPVTDFGKLRVEALRRGETVHSNDVATDPRFSDAELEIFRTLETRSFVSVGLTKSGQWLGAFGVHSRTPRVWTNAEIELIQEVAERSWSAAERARADEVLREREQRLRLALDASRAGSWMRDVRPYRVNWDDRFCEIYGFTAGEPASFEVWLSRVHEEDRPQVLELWNQIQHTKTHDTFDTTFRIVRPEGTVSWIQSLGQVHRDADRQVMRLTGLDLDVTERRRAEESFRENQVRESFLLRLADTLRPLSDPLDIQEVAARLLGEHLRVNRAGYAEIEGDQYMIRREYVNGVAPLAGSGRTSTFGAGMREVYRRGEPVAVNDVSTDPRFSDPDRALYLGNQIAAFVGVMLLKGGRLVAAFGVNTSTSRVWTPMEVQLIREVAERTWAAVERAHAEAELRVAHDTLERRVRDRTAELAVRNAQLRRLASQLTLTEQHAREQLARTLHDGLQQLLFIAGITLDRAVKSASPADQVGLLQNARAKINETMEAARTLSVDLFPPVLHTAGLPAALDWLARRTQEEYGVVVDATADARANPESSDVRILLFGAVRELLFNAVKYAHTDRVDINLALRPDDIIHINVSDEGVGFDPAVTLHYKNEQQVGLGLFSIRERLALLGGHLDIQSAPGKGARFSLMLPRTDLQSRPTDNVEAPFQDAGQGKRLAYASAGGTKRVRILVADDHVVARAGLRELFSERPELQVLGEAANGVEAISQATALQPDVIVMDVSMPQMNGIEATRQIHGTLPHIRIVGLSTYDDEDTKRAMLKAGAEAYFTKNEAADRLLDHLLSIRPTAKGAARS